MRKTLAVSVALATLFVGASPAQATSQRRIHCTMDTPARQGQGYNLLVLTDTPRYVGRAFTFVLTTREQVNDFRYVDHTYHYTGGRSVYTGRVQGYPLTVSGAQSGSWCDRWAR